MSTLIPTSILRLIYTHTHICKYVCIYVYVNASEHMCVQKINTHTHTHNRTIIFLLIGKKKNCNEFLVCLRLVPISFTYTHKCAHVCAHIYMGYDPFTLGYIKSHTLILLNQMVKIV